MEHAHGLYRAHGFAVRAHYRSLAQKYATATISTQCDLSSKRLTMSEVTIRPAVPSERKHLEDLQRRASLNNPGDRDVLLANPDAITMPLRQIVDGQVFVAERYGKIEGFSVVILRDDGDAELDGLFVAPECWGQGIGRALMDRSEIAAKGAGARYLHVIGNTHAEHFYTACGFQAFGSAPTRFGIGLLLKKAL